MIFGEDVFGEHAFQSSSFEGSWLQSYAFNFLAGTTVSVLMNLTATIPLGTTVDIYAGETETTLSLVPNNVKTALLFVSPVSGSTNLYVKLILKSNQSGITPVISSLAITLYQSTSLYTIATDILSSGLADTNTSYLIDTELQKFPIPYAWFTPVKHRFALSKVVEACGGVAYQNRYGTVKIDAGNIFSRQGINGNVFLIEDDRILDISSPISVIKNKVQVEIHPLVALSDQVIWTLTSDNEINNGQSRTFEVFWTDYDVATDVHSSLSSSPSGSTITAETFYSWGATITVLGSADSQVLTLSVSGKPLSIVGTQIIQETDGESIRINGEQSLVISDNNLIQSREIAELIAESIINITSTPRRDIDLQWRGDPTLELGDIGLVNEDQGVIVMQEFTFNGALECNSKIRRL